MSARPGSVLGRSTPRRARRPTRGCGTNEVSPTWRPGADGEDLDESPTLQRLRRRVCGVKAAYSAKGARGQAERMRCLGELVSPYRCVFCHWWHVGHTPSMETVEALAKAIRGLVP